MQLMKKTLKGMLLSASAVALFAAAGSTGLAQGTTAPDPCEGKEKLFTEQIKPNAKSTMPWEKQTIAYQAAKEFLSKYSTCEGAEAIVTYLRDTYIPAYEKAEKARKEDALRVKFNDALKSNDTARLFAAGKEYIAGVPSDSEVVLPVMLYMVDSGYTNQLRKKNTSFNAETITIAKQAIAKIESNRSATNFGPYTDREYALAYSNFAIGYIDTVGNKQKKQGAESIYKALQHNSDLKTWFYPYDLIGDLYFDEYTKAAADYNTKYKDIPVDDTAKVEEAKQAAGIYKAYADRTIDAYARAYKYAKADTQFDTKNPAIAKGFYQTLTDFYKARNKNDAKGLDEAYVSKIVAAPMPNPATAVTPVIEVETETNATNTPVTMGVKANNGSSAAAETKASSPAKTAATATKAPTKKPAPAKKPAPKKSK